MILPFNYFRGTARVIQKTINTGEVKEQNAEILTLFIYSVLLGGAINEYHLRNFERNVNLEGWKASESEQYQTIDFTSKQYRKYILKKIELGLRDSNLIVT